jgi:predicted Zn-dependent protease
VAVLFSLLGGCATTAPTTRPQATFWPLDDCVAAATDNVPFYRPDNPEPAAIIPKRTCEAMKSASEKIQTVSGFALSGVFIIEVKNPNAFATRNRKGQPIAVVTIGMMNLLAADEDAWAGLLGHEIAHHVRRHGDVRAGAQAKARGAGNVVGQVVSAAIPGVGGIIGGTIAATATQMAVFNSYTRPQEAEADEFGMQWMVDAGYDPRGLVRLFDTLGAGRSSSAPAFLSSHPAPEDRKLAVEAFIAKGPKPRPLPNRTPPPAETTQTAYAGAVIADAQNCEEATSATRLQAICSSAEGCLYEVDAIKKFCPNARADACTAAHEQLFTHCGERSSAYSERDCQITARQVRANCAGE